MPTLEDKEAYFSDYLATLCHLIPNIDIAGLFWVATDKQLQVLAKYPALSTDLAVLVGISEQTLQDDCGLVQSYEGPLNANHLVGFPVTVANKTQLVIVMAVQADSEESLHNVMGQIEWSLAQLERYFLEQQVHQLENSSKTSIKSNQILGQVLSQATFKEAVVSLVENFARQTHSERVSLGQFDGLKCKVLAISNTLDFSEKLALVEAIQSAQLEAQMQKQACVFPVEDNPSPFIIRAHEALSISQGHHAVLTLLIYDYKDQKPVFAVTFERSGKKPFKEQEVQSLSHMITLSGAVILDKLYSEQSIFKRMKLSISSQLVKLFGPGYTIRKSFLMISVILFMLFYWLPGQYRLSAEAKLEALNQFYVTMPFDGYLDASDVRAGDYVELNQLVASLDKRSYHLELLKAQSKRQQFLTEFSLAQSEEDRSKMAVLSAQIKQIDTDIKMANLYLRRADIVAPVNGLVIEGDLTPRLGDALKTGEVLFIIAKDNAYRVQVKVPESRVMDIKTGQKGRLILQSLPNEVFEIEINKLTPMQVVEEGGHFYKAEAEIINQSDTPRNIGLKPGMQGVVKIDIDERNQFGIWFRDTYEWIILTWWRWFGD